MHEYAVINSKLDIEFKYNADSHTVFSFSYKTQKTDIAHSVFIPPKYGSVV